MDAQKDLELQAYLGSLVEPIAPDVRIEAIDQPRKRDGRQERVSRVHVPRSHQALLVGHDGFTCQAIRTMVRTYCQSRRWADLVNVRVVRSA